MAIYSHILFVNKNVCHILKIKKYDSAFHCFCRLNWVFIGEVKDSQHCEMRQNCVKNTSESLKTHQNTINLPLNTTKDQWVPEKTEYDDYIVKQAKKLYKNQKVSPEEINLRYDALKRKDMFKEITNIKLNTFVAYRHLIAIAITFENDHGKSVYHYLKKEGLF